MTPSERAATIAVAWPYFEKRELRQGNRLQVQCIDPVGIKRLFIVERKGLFIRREDGEIDMKDYLKDFKIYNEKAIKENNVIIEHTERYNKIYFEDMASSRIKGNEKCDGGRFLLEPILSNKCIKFRDESQGRIYLYQIELSL